MVRIAAAERRRLVFVSRVFDPGDGGRLAMTATSSPIPPAIETPTGTVVSKAYLGELHHLPPSGRTVWHDML
jgi:hypothetical protein